MDSPCLVSNGSCWSKLPSKLLNKVSKCLGFEDFQEAKSVSPSPSAPNNQIPWLIIFPEKGKDYCLLFNPQEKDKVHRIQDLGDNFANSHCLAICGSWLFKRDPRCNLYIMNLLTREMIDLPSIESQFGRIKIERTIDDMFDVKVDGGYIGAPEKHIVMRFLYYGQTKKTKDYVVMWYIRYGQYLYLVYSRKGDNRWKHGNYCSSGTFVYDMVYKDHKIYLYTDSSDVKVLDFSRDIPRKIFETKVKYDYWRGVKGMPRRLNPGDVWFIKETHLVVTLSGEALRVKSIIRSDSDVWSLRIYKMDSSNRNWEKLSSLGDEAILLDLRITVLANAIERINRNSIYFSGYRSGHPRAWSEKDILIFNLDTHEVERPHQSILSSIQSSDARWFVPNFKKELD